MIAFDPWKLKPDYMRIGASFGCKSTGSKKRGIDYHRSVYKTLRQHVTDKMPGWKLLIEPWYRNLRTHRFRQPDAVLIHTELKIGIVIEVKLNWKDGRDVKLIDEYLPIVRAAHELDVVWPLIIVRCTRGYQHPVLLQLDHIDRCQSWLRGDPTPMMLVI